jgi:hypothetical protein
LLPRPCHGKKFLCCVEDCAIWFVNPKKMYWRPDRMICEYEVDGVRLREEKFIAAGGAACSMITSSRPVSLRLGGQSFFGRNSLTSTATIEYNKDNNAIHIVEGGTTKCRPETDSSEQVGSVMYQGMSTVLAASRNFATSHQFTKGEHGEMQYEFDVPCDSNPVVLVWAMHDDYRQALKDAMEVLGTSGGILRPFQNDETERRQDATDTGFAHASDYQHDARACEF